MNESSQNDLRHIHAHHVQWEGKSGVFSILGALSMDVSSLRVTLHLSAIDTPKQRFKIDLYDYAQVVRESTRLSEEFNFNYGQLESDFLSLTECLEKYREDILMSLHDTTNTKREMRVSLKEEKELVEILKNPSLLDLIDERLAGIGIAGEEQNRMILFLIAMSYKYKPLHAIVQSSSGSGKSHLINTIAECLPDEDVLSLSRISSKSLYHFKNDTLKNKLLIIQDFDGLDEEALYALRELQSYGKLTSSVTGKDAFGNLSARLHTVFGHFSSIGASTKDIYTDNASRSLILKIDESSEQTKTILNYTVPQREEIIENKTYLKNLVRLLKSETVFNPFSERLTLDNNIPMVRRLNNQLLEFINQITFLNQYQRERDTKGRIIATLKDVEKGIELFSDCLWMKVDELSPNVRIFFEQLKDYVKSQNTNEDEEISFNQRELRHALHIPKTNLQRHIKALMELEYLHIVSGSANKGYRYALQFVDDQNTLKNNLINELSKSYKSA